jgi:hypothetical protein
MRNCLTPILMTILLSSTAVASTEDKVAEIEVSIDLPAVTNPAAAMRYTHVSDDLKAAIAARLDGRLDPSGVNIGIDISELELSNSFTDVIGAADTRLVGVVSQSDLTDNSHFERYELTVDVNQAKTFFPVDFDLTKQSASSNEFYQAMIAAFADAVVTHINE